jgi:hypothetical protein
MEQGGPRKGEELRAPATAVLLPPKPPRPPTRSYFWDVACGSRLTELEHVDKQAVFSALAPCGAAHGAAVVRTLDGRAQLVRRWGAELSGLGQETWAGGKRAEVGRSRGCPPSP